MISISNAGAEFKPLAYRTACARGDIAYDSTGRTHPLRNFAMDDVEFIAGLWRVQNKFEHKIQIVRDKEFVLGEKINRTEKNLFEFYRAFLVGHNCYGRFISDNGLEHVVAKYDTDDETFWSYGNSIEQARAFLGIRLYDKYMDLIHSAACKNKLLRK